MSPVMFLKKTAEVNSIKTHLLTLFVLQQKGVTMMCLNTHM